MKKILSILTVVVLMLSVTVATFSVNAAEVGSEYYLDGIGTDSLEHWAFYYTTAPEGEDPTADMRPLSKPGRQTVDNGCWPFQFDLWAYDDPSWELGVPGIDAGAGRDGYALVFYSDAQYLFMYVMNKDDTYYRSIAAFTAPEDGTYNISFGGSVSWSPDQMSVNAWLNGSMIEGSGYVFSTVQGEKDMGNTDVIKPYSLEVELKAGEELCLVFEYPVSENRANVENLTATLIDKPSSDEQTTTGNENGSENGNGGSSGISDGDESADVTPYIVTTVISLVISVVCVIITVVTVIKSKKK